MKKSLFILALLLASGNTATSTGTITQEQIIAPSGSFTNDTYITTTGNGVSSSESTDSSTSDKTLDSKGNLTVTTIANNGIINSTNSGNIYSGNSIYISNTSTNNIAHSTVDGSITNSGNINIDSINNNGTLNGSTTNGNYSGNGVAVINLSSNNNLYTTTSPDQPTTAPSVTDSGNIELNSLINSGIIKGHVSSGNSASGNGLLFLTSSTSMANYYSDGKETGDKAGEKENITSSNDIFIGSISNLGSIYGILNGSGVTFGKGILANGIAITNLSQSTLNDITLNNLNNSGIIIGDTGSLLDKSSSHSGNGILLKGSSSSVSGNINNTGLIKGSSSLGGSFLGNGIVAITETDLESKINSITNIGVILGEHSTGMAYPSGHGIVIANNVPRNKATLSNLSNSGIIGGNSDTSFLSGSGIYLYASTSYIGTINNNGVIRGYSPNNSWEGGYGVYAKEINTLTNTGLIAGSSSAISFAPTTYINAGVIAEQTNISSANQGIYISLNSSNNVSSVQIGSSGTLDGKTILNASSDGTIATTGGILTGVTDIYIDSENLVSKENLIINGVGTDTGALYVGSNNELYNSIVNGYDTALYVDNGSYFKGSNVIFNGGHVDGSVAVIKGSEGDEIIFLSNGSIINGSTELGAGDDNLNLAYSTQINGILDGGAGTGDILNFSLDSTGNKSISILYDIINFENINITEGNVTLFENANIIGSNINISEGGDLTLRVDPTIKDESGIVIGHGLHGNTGDITSDGTGDLIFALNGLGESTIIDMGGTNISGLMQNDDDPHNDQIDTDSIVLNATLITSENKSYYEDKYGGPLTEGDVIIGVASELPIIPETPDTSAPSNTNELYHKQNLVYKSIVSAGEIGKLANTTEITPGIDGDYTEETKLEAQAQLLWILDQMYDNSPYAFTLKSTRDSLKIIQDNMGYLTIKPMEDEWVSQVKGFYTNRMTHNKAYARNLHGYDPIGSMRDFDTSSYSMGGVATLEHGLSDTASLGIAFAGHGMYSHLSGITEINNHSVYLGGFGKKEFGNLKFTVGGGYQYTSTWADRHVANEKDHLATSSRYYSNSLSAYAEGKYTFNVNEETVFEPMIKISGYYVMQNDITEGESDTSIAINVDEANALSGDIELGFNIAKEKYTKSGRKKYILSLSAIHSFGDGKDNPLTARVVSNGKYGSDFELDGMDLAEYSGKIAYNYEYERETGIIFTSGISYERSTDDEQDNFGLSLGLGARF